MQTIWSYYLVSENRTKLFPTKTLG
jgi:hypothetical protein